MWENQGSCRRVPYGTASGEYIIDGHAQPRVPAPRTGLIEKLGKSDGTWLCLIAATCALVSSVQNFKVSPLSDDGFTNKEYSELVTGTIEVSVSFPYIVLILHESVPDMLPIPAVLAPLESWITCHPNVRIFRDTIILVVISFLILLDIHLSFLWLAIFPVMAIVFIGALYFKFSPPTGGSGGEGTSGYSNVIEKTNRETREIKIIVMMAFGALVVMDQLPDQLAETLPMSQFLLFLSSTVAALTHMMMKLPGSASLPGIAPASEMLHKTLLLLLLVTLHTVAAEWLGEDVVLLCLPEVIPVLLWSGLHLNGKQVVSSTIISFDKIKQFKKSLPYKGAVVASLIAHAATSKDELVLSSWCTTFLVSCGVSGILTYYLVFMLSHWPTQQAAAAAKDGASGMQKLCRA